MWFLSLCTYYEWIINIQPVQVPGLNIMLSDVFFFQIPEASSYI